MAVQSPRGVIAHADRSRPAPPALVPEGLQFRLRLLDGFRLDQGGRNVPMPKAPRRLIAFLGIKGRCSRTEIVGNLWPEVSEPKAHASLRTVLWRLRQMTDAPLVVGGGQALSLAPRVEVDVARFVSIARQLLATASAGGPPSPSDRAPVSVGELLPGWYEDWVLFERERLRQLQMHALEAVALRLTAEGHHADAIEAALAAVRIEPLRESATRVLIMAYIAEHNVVEAVRRFQAFRNQLRQELGVTPSADLERLVFGGCPPRAGGAPAADAPGRRDGSDIGHQRLAFHLDPVASGAAADRSNSRARG